MFYPAWKRIFDIFGSALGLLVLLPLSPFIALAVKLNSSGPILVKLNRVSRGKIIKVYKFRSMVADAQQLKNGLLALNERKDGPFFKMKKDPRITGAGRILRQFKLDELPQLFNVLKGDLSLIGPRPHEPEEMFHYPSAYRHLLLAKTGVTGLSQINGASNLPFLKELAYDDFYVKNQSVRLDLKIFFKTLWIMIFDPHGV